MEKLNRRAFPANERRPLLPLLEDPTGTSDVFAFAEGGVFCGFVCLLTWKDLTHIIYFAMEEALRSQGYGSQALALLAQAYPGHRLFADLEAEIPGAANAEERKRRRSFYLRNGYRPTAVRYSWRGEQWEILSLGGDVSDKEFTAFWQAMGQVGLASY